jgi:hypothetical protein
VTSNEIRFNEKVFCVSNNETIRDSEVGRDVLSVRLQMLWGQRQ